MDKKYCYGCGDLKEIGKYFDENKNTKEVETINDNVEIKNLLNKIMIIIEEIQNDINYLKNNR